MKELTVVYSIALAASERYWVSPVIMHFSSIKNFYMNLTGKHKRQITFSECQEVSFPGILAVGKM